MTKAVVDPFMIKAVGGLFSSLQQGRRERALSAEKENTPIPPSDEEEAEVIETFLQSLIQTAPGANVLQKLTPEEEAERKKMMRRRLLEAMDVLQSSPPDEVEVLIASDHVVEITITPPQTDLTQAGDREEEDEASWIKAASAVIKDYFNTTTTKTGEEVPYVEDTCKKEGSDVRRRKQWWANKWEASLQRTEEEAAKTGEDCIALFRQMKETKRKNNMG